jgi:hypothetical protein
MTDYTKAMTENGATYLAGAMYGAMFEKFEDTKMPLASKEGLALCREIMSDSVGYHHLLACVVVDQQLDGL